MSFPRLLSRQRPRLRSHDREQDKCRIVEKTSLHIAVWPWSYNYTGGGMTSSPGLRGRSRLQCNYSAVECYRRRQTTTDAREQNNTGPYAMLSKPVITTTRAKICRFTPWIFQILQSPSPSPSHVFYGSGALKIDQSTV